MDGLSSVSVCVIAWISKQRPCSPSFLHQQLLNLTELWVLWEAPTFSATTRHIDGPQSHRQHLTELHLTADYLQVRSPLLQMSDQFIHSHQNRNYDGTGLQKNHVTLRSLPTKFGLRAFEAYVMGPPLFACCFQDWKICCILPPWMAVFVVVSFWRVRFPSFHSLACYRHMGGPSICIPILLKFANPLTRTCKMMCRSTALPEQLSADAGL